MSLNSWLQNLGSSTAPHRGQRNHRRRRSLRPATHRIRQNLETLEDRRLLSFTPAMSFPVGIEPQAVVTADFNNDGHVDLATANPGPDTVSVLLGDGGGGFSAAIDSPLGFFWANRVSLTVADFDNDSYDDLACAVYNPETGVFGAGLGVLLSNGDGTFGSLIYVGTAAYTLAVAAGDFNNDGNSDLVVSGDDGMFYGFVQVLSGNGQGGFAQMSPHWLFNGWNAELTVGDLNGDGNLDAVAVVGEAGAGGAAVLGNGAGGFFSDYVFGTTIDRSGGVAVGDFTGDGIPDLVVAGEVLPVPDGVDVLVGRGDGTFSDATPYSANGNMHTGVAVGDFNGDGQFDAVTSDGKTSTVSELLGNGNGALAYAGAYAVGSSTSAIAVGDFNGDGRPDVATANAGSNTVSVLLNDGIWTPAPPTPPTVRIGDATVTEGNTGTVNATFTVTLSAAFGQSVTVAYATANGTAAGSDYQAVSGTLMIPAGQTTGTITVLVNGDRVAEPNETFFVNLSNPTNATIADGVGSGTIVDDEPRISINNVAKYEGKGRKTTLFTFTVTLSAAYDQPVTMSFRTANGTATTSDGDYVAKTGTLTFNPGETAKTITIEVKGDNKKEAHETFYLDLFDNSSNSLFAKNRGIGTILNDDN